MYFEIGYAIIQKEKEKMFLILEHEKTKTHELQLVGFSCQIILNGTTYHTFVRLYIKM